MSRSFDAYDYPPEPTDYSDDGGVWKPCWTLDRVALAVIVVLMLVGVMWPK